MVHGGMTLVKYLLFLFNFIFWLCGIAVLSIGIVIQINYRQALNLLGDDFLAAPYLLISVGSLVAILGFFGCCGAIRENYCMTMTFAVLLTVIFLLEMAACIACYVSQKAVQSGIITKLKEGMVRYQPPENGEYKPEVYYISYGWDILQSQFECCGVGDEGYMDWSNVTVYVDNTNVPDSCCVLQETQQQVNPGCGGDVRGDDDLDGVIHQEGCVSKVKSFVVMHVAVFGGVAAAVTFVQIALLILSCLLSRWLREYYGYDPYY